jgi:hypothetical protein
MRNLDTVTLIDRDGRERKQIGGANKKVAVKRG